MNARWWTSNEDGSASCGLCPHKCRINVNSKGICGIRENQKNELVATQFGRIAAMSMDPIEKKPLYHFHPGESILSIGGYGCNLSCVFCQNWHLSTKVGRTTEVLPERLVEEALESDSFGICFTYNEPLINLEYVLDTFAHAKKKGIKTVIVSNGFINRQPLNELAPVLDAANIDIKGCSEKFYRELCAGSLKDELRLSHFYPRNAMLR